MITTISRTAALVSLALLITACSTEEAPEPAASVSHPVASAVTDTASSEETQAIVLLRGLPTLNTNHSDEIV